MLDQFVGRVLVLLCARFGGELRYVREACLVALLTGCCEFIFAEYHIPFADGTFGNKFVFGKWVIVHQLQHVSFVLTSDDQQGACAVNDRTGDESTAFVEAVVLLFDAHRPDFKSSLSASVVIARRG